MRTGLITPVKSSVETLSPTRVKLSVELPFTDVQPSLDAALKRLGTQLRIPGFRPGKAPARIIEQRVGRAALLEEAVNETVPRAYSEAVREQDIKAVGQPEIEVTDLDDGNHVNFTAEVDVRPEFDTPDYQNLSVEVADVEVAEEQVDEQLDSLRERFATLTAVERAVQTGDYVLLDLKATIDGDEVEGGSASGLSYEVGAGDLIDGLDDALVGLEPGGEVVFTSTLRAGDRSGQEAQILATVGSVKEKELPAADDDFAQLASEFDTIEEVREDLRTRLGRVGVLTQGTEARDKVLDTLLDSVDIPLPESAVKAEVEWREHDVVHSFDHDDNRLAEFLESEGKTREQFDAEIRQTAERSVKSQFVLDKIAEAENVQVEDDELSTYLVRQAQRYDMAPQEFANQLLQSGNLPAVVADVRRNKALATVLERASVTDASGRPVDLSALTSTPADIEDGGVADLTDDSGDVAGSADTADTED